MNVSPQDKVLAPLLAIRRLLKGGASKVGKYSFACKVTTKREGCILGLNCAEGTERDTSGNVVVII